MSKFKIGDKVIIKSDGSDNNWVGTIDNIDDLGIWCKDWTEPSGKIHPYCMYSVIQNVKSYIPYLNEQKLKKVLNLK